MAYHCTHPDFTARVDGRFVEAGTWDIVVALTWRSGITAKFRNEVIPEARLALSLGIAEELASGRRLDARAVHIRLSGAAAEIRDLALPSDGVELVPANRG